MHDNVFVDSNLWLYAFVLRPGEEVKHARALALLEARKFSFWDSLIVAAALEPDCPLLYSEDMQHGQMIDQKLTILNPLLEAATSAG